MIFVTLGTHELPFNRLLNELEKIDIDTKVVIQCGNTDFKSNKYEVFKFLNHEEFDYYMKNSDIVICHGGVGSILQGLRYNKKIILAPRLAKYNEHNDDHQVEICNKFHKEQYAIIYNEGDNLKEIISKVKDLSLKKYKFDNSKLLNYISDYLDLKTL